MLNPTDLQSLCKVLRENKIDYLAIEGSDHDPDFEINYSFFKENLQTVYTNQKSKLTIYRTNPACDRMPLVK